MKKISLLFIASIISITMLAGCSSSSSSETSTDSETIYLRVAGEFPVDHPVTNGLYEFAEKVHSDSDGRIEIDVYPAGQLGDYTAIYDEVSRGTIELAQITVPSELDNRFELVYMPYLTTNHSDLEKVYGSESFVFKTLEEVHQNYGVKLLGILAGGFDGIGTVKEVNNIMDFGEDKDILIRTPPLDIFNQSMKDIGFRTITIPFNDLYTALQTGTVEGWQGGEASLNYTGFRDIIKYYYVINDYLSATSFVMNNEFWESLDENDQQIIENAAKEYSLNTFNTAEASEKEYRDKLKEEGIEVIEFSDDELEEMADYVRKTTWPKLKDRLGDEIIDNLVEEIK